MMSGYQERRDVKKALIFAVEREMYEEESIYESFYIQYESEKLISNFCMIIYHIVETF